MTWRSRPENLLGREGEGFKIAMFALDQGRYTVAAGATGLIRACRDASVKRTRASGDLRRRDRPAPARQGDDRADGVRLSGARLLWLRSGG
jgi:glutaryl-CoA dehydrogenase (non-decarboxylating)